MNFFQTIKNCIYSPEFYKSIPKKSFWQSIKYFLLLILLLTVIGLIFSFQDLFIEKPISIQNLVKNTLNCYPKDLEIKISNGEVSTNVKEPYFIESCASSFWVSATKGRKTTVIDTKNSFSQSKLADYNADSWLTKDAFIATDGTITKFYSLKEYFIDNFTLNKATLNSFYDKFSPYLIFIGPILLIFSFLYIFIFHLFILFQLLLTASLIWLLGKIFKHDLNFSSSYKIGLFATTLGLIVDLAVNATSKWTNFSGFSFMFTAITLGVVIINVFLPKRSSS